MRYMIISSSDARQGDKATDALSADGKILFDAVFRRQGIAAIIGLLIPLILDIAYYSGLNRYISKNVILAVLINAFGLVGFIIVPTITNSKKKQLRKFVQVSKKNYAAGVIRKLEELNDPEAWRIFYGLCRWSDMCFFFVGMWFGTVLSAAFEISIYPFLINL